MLIGKLSPEERAIGDDMLYAVKKSRGLLSAAEVAEALGVDVSLIAAVWAEQ